MVGWVNFRDGLKLFLLGMNSGTVLSEWLWDWIENFLPLFEWLKFRDGLLENYRLLVLVFRSGSDISD